MACKIDSWHWQTMDLVNSGREAEKSTLSSSEVMKKFDVAKSFVNTSLEKQKIRSVSRFNPLLDPEAG